MDLRLGLARLFAEPILPANMKAAEVSAAFCFRKRTLPNFTK